jgi:lipopolysaccharide transport system ATP-binding protein
MTFSDSDVLIKVQNTSKKFCRNFQKSLWYGLKDTAYDILNITDKKHDADFTSPQVLNSNNHSTKNTLPKLRDSEFWAIRDVSFELKRGECLGLIGRNGAGKTTLLKLLNGIIKPDYGSIEIKGKVGALIALGCGFDPILSGRENIYINGSVLGLDKREIDAKLDEIIDFAELHEAIDAPVRTYSSGMSVRLGFSIATSLNPDVLILDEVLAVGDANFRSKCYNRIGKMRESAATIFVSHTMGQVAQVCDSILLLNNGICEYKGDLDIGIKKYNTYNEQKDEDGHSFLNIEYPILSAKTFLVKEQISYNDHLTFRFEIISAKKIQNNFFRIIFYDENQTPFAEWNSQHHQEEITLNEGLNKIELKVGPLNFKTGNYPIGININSKSEKKMLLWSFKEKNIRVESFASHGHTIFLNSCKKVSFL